MDFQAHVATHLASQLALQRAKQTGDTGLYSMIMSALQGTWIAAQKKACKDCKEGMDVN